MTTNVDKLEKQFEEYSRDCNTLNKYREHYANKIKQYAKTIGCTEWIINLGVCNPIEFYEDGYDHCRKCWCKANIDEDS